MYTTIKVLPEQIPLVWDTIKLAAARSQEVDEPALPHLYQQLLVELLNDTMQCFVIMDSEKVILQVILTQIQIQRLTGSRDLLVVGLYSFRKIEETSAIEMWNKIVAVARNQKCDRVTCQSHNARLWTLYDTLGLKETSRQYEYVLGGV